MRIWCYILVGPVCSTMNSLRSDWLEMIDTDKKDAHRFGFTFLVVFRFVSLEIRGWLSCICNLENFDWFLKRFHRK
jgi:hypothetical protein